MHQWILLLFLKAVLVHVYVDSFMNSCTQRIKEHSTSGFMLSAEEGCHRIAHFTDFFNLESY